MSIEPLNADLNIIQNLVIPAFSDNVDIIQELDDEPNDTGGLTSAELKKRFDTAGNLIKKYLNETFIPTMSDTVAEAEVRRTDEATRQANEEERKQAETLRKATFGEVLAVAQEARETSVASKDLAVSKASDSEAYAVGTRGGVPVGSTDAAYQNNSMHYMELAKSIAGGLFDPLGSAEQVKQELTLSISSVLNVVKSILDEQGDEEDTEIQSGRFSNAGSGFNTFHFPMPFLGVPRVVLQAESFSGFIEIKDITEIGFLYCLRLPSVSGGTATKNNYLTATGTANTSTHNASSLVDAVTFPTYQTTTTADPIYINWVAIEQNGDELA